MFNKYMNKKLLCTSLARRCQYMSDDLFFLEFSCKSRDFKESLHEGRGGDIDII